MDERVNDLLEIVPGLGVIENYTGQLPSVERAGRVDDIRTEAGNDRGKSRTARLHGLPGQDIGINRRHTQFLEHCTHVALARRNSAGERDPSCHEYSGTNNHQPLSTNRLSPLSTTNHQLPTNHGSATAGSFAGAIRSSTKVFHSWHCGHCHSSSVLR